MRQFRVNSLPMRATVLLTHATKLLPRTMATLSSTQAAAQTATAVAPAAHTPNSPSLRGARIGLYGISNVGKSTCMSRIARLNGGLGAEGVPLLTYDSSEVLYRMVGGDKAWEALPDAEKERLRRKKLDVIAEEQAALARGAPNVLVAGHASFPVDRSEQAQMLAIWDDSDAAFFDVIVLLAAEPEVVAARSATRGSSSLQGRTRLSAERAEAWMRFEAATLRRSCRCRPTPTPTPTAAGDGTAAGPPGNSGGAHAPLLVEAPDPEAAVTAIIQALRFGADEARDAALHERMLLAAAALPVFKNQVDSAVQL